ETPGPAGPKTRKEPRDHHKTLTTVALAVITALSIALLCSLSYNYGAVGAQSGASATSPKRIAGEPTRELWPFPPARQHQLIVRPGKAGASACLSLVTYNAGIGGDPAISSLKDSRSGPVLLLSGFPAGTAIRFLSTGADQSCRTRSAVSRRNHPFPPGG